MKAHSSQAGFGHIAVVFLVLFVAVAGFAGYKVVTMNSAQKDDATVATQTQQNAVVPDQIKSKADLVQTAKVLDNSSSSVDGSLNDNSLNQDLNDML